MSFWRELRRPNVFKVGDACAVMAWLIIQWVSTISPLFQLPACTMTLIIVELIVCFTVALILTLAYEVTPDGIKSAKEVPRTENRSKRG